MTPSASTGSSERGTAAATRSKKPKRPKKPRRGAKCRIDYHNAPGWLDVTSYLESTASCSVDRDAQHVVELVNNSPLPYRILIESRCLTGAVQYVGPEGTEPTWSAKIEKLHEWSMRGEANRLAIRRPVRSITDAEGERIELTAKWECFNHPGSGTTAPVVILVDATC
jgi:hypothetical protein